jgi:acetyltransferase
MTVRNFDHLFQPRSVVLVGASCQKNSVGQIIARNLVGAGFEGPVWFVNPKHRRIEGRECFPTIEALPAAADLAVIATPAETVPGLIDRLGIKGTRAAIVITAGIRDDLQRAMLQAAQPHTLRIQGPNCVGLILPGIGLNASFAVNADAGDIAFVSQSGALITAVIDWARGRRIGFSHVVSLGDMADVDFGDMLDHLATDARCRSILLYMESITHAPKFMSAARRAARLKPVIVVKAGRSASGAAAAQSHTGALAGTDAAYEAAFRRAGLLRVHELGDLFSAAAMLARHDHIVGDALAILTNGGGAGVLAADRLGDLGGNLAVLSQDTLHALGAALPPTWSHGNPIDIVGDADEQRYQRALEIVLGAEEAQAVLVMNCPTALTSSTRIADTIIAGVQQRRARPGGCKPLLATWLGDEAARPAHQAFAAHDIASFATPAEAIEGFMQLVRYNRAQSQLMQTPPSLPQDLQLNSNVAADTIAGAIGSGRSVLSEVESKEVLAAYGIPVVPTKIAQDPAQVGRLAALLLADHEACAIKVLSDDISHKSDVGGVHLNLRRADEATAAAEHMLERIAQTRPTARIKGFTVQPMIRRPAAFELILGMSVDRTFGPLMMFGAGGTAVEALRDTAHALPPLDLNLARDLMQHTRVWRLLQGYRDRPAADIDCIAQALVRLSYLAARHPEIHELDVNPLLADDQGVMALDARIVVADPAKKPRQAMAIRPYPSEWLREDSLPSLGAIRIRPIRPDDEPLYQRFFADVTNEDRRLRFFGAGPNLSHVYLARLTQIDYAREMAFIATGAESGALLGVVRMIADPDYLRAEYAILVRSDLKGAGLGWRLMQHLISYARSEGLQELHGSVLASNTTMLSMCRELGFAIDTDPEDPTIRRVRLSLASNAMR